MSPQALPTTPSPHRRPDRIGRRAIALAAVAGSVALGVLTVAVPSASAATPPVPHNPIGSTRSITAIPAAQGGGLLATGWAGDLDAATHNVRVYALQDGKKVIASTKTDIAMSSITKAKGLGATPGFALTVPVSTGVHTVCIVAHDLGRGIDKVMKCVVTPLGSNLSSAALALHSPQGAVTSASASASTDTADFQGWTTDADDLSRRSTVVLDLDGVTVATVTTQSFAASAVLPVGAGRRSAFDISVPVASGTHEGCLWAVNVGLGSNTMLGCQAVDTRAGQAITGGAPATISAKVVKEAKKHIGQAYVWGAAGPKTFDCSGLVTYSYGKFGFTTPRVSSDQFRAARLIPASDAVPGDLVFYHDESGDVYHVGIYLSPLKTVAAIDTAEGVNYQSIWDPSTATYGSFTHT